MTGPASPAPDAPPDGPSDDEWSRAPLSPALALPRVGGIYAALLGGNGNRAADRAAAWQLAAAIPGAERAVGGPVLFWAGIGLGRRVASQGTRLATCRRLVPRAAS
jgi:hypothetical protein